GLLLSACASSPPAALNASVPDGAAEVRLDAPLDVTATGAVLQRVGLERIDVPTTVTALEPTTSPVRLQAALLPDARYRLTAVAQIPSVGIRLPWQVEAARDLILERVFSTVRTPTLQAVPEPIVVQRGEPIELRFSQPLARALASVSGANAHAEIAGSDGRLLRVQIDDPAPG